MKKLDNRVPILQELTLYSIGTFYAFICFAGTESLRSWYGKVVEFGNKAFNDIATAMYDRGDEILNYFVNRSTNASAEYFNAKVKQIRSLLRSIMDRKFFLFRLTKIYA